MEKTSIGQDSFVFKRTRQSFNMDILQNKWIMKQDEIQRPNSAW